MNFLYIIIVLIIVVLSVVLHELSHGIVAYWLGDNTAKDAGRLSFNPLKHIDPYMSILVPVVLFILRAPVFGGAKPVPINRYNLKWQEWGMALVAIAGPLTNFFLAFIFFLVGHFTGLLYGGGGELPEFIFGEIIFINLGFMIFNLIPIPPLDGSRVLYAIAPDGFRNLLLSIEQYGFIIVYALIFLFGEVFSSLMISATQGILDFFYLIVGK
ncbi:site-2 protease family protein [Candidatus Saccharibacteria bacterium]|nr:site-2 protease family protein [Candidatus Saccharibacteria bacterium]MBR2995020.1 site-2 protease family protein [Candidatus Saccharibacteria bacterium]MBR2995029.1 site-2 protease family protein [Candidatus Saccharibacteria bacterium]